MVTCPEGHSNPAHWEFCGQCGAPLDEAAEELETQKWSRTKWAVGGAGILAVLVIAAAAVALVVTRDGDQTSSSAPAPVGAGAIREWWSAAHEPFTELQESVNDLQRAVDDVDGTAIVAACQQMHDTADVELQALLPTPDPALTSELRAATADAHAGAHMCLAVVGGSVNSYAGEFMANIDQAEKHMTAAEELIDEALIAIP
jgi:hypothetical protein